MVRFVLSLVVLAVILMLPPGVSADPYTCNASGCTWQTSYTEPSTLTNGQALTDLVSCTASYTTAVDAGPPSAAKTFTIPASKPAGGGAITKNNTDPAMLPSHTSTIAETLACTSTAFGTGAASPAASLLMNSGVAPNPTAAPGLQ